MIGFFFSYFFYFYSFEGGDWTWGVHKKEKVFLNFYFRVNFFFIDCLSEI